jgi:hypothetical protein
MKTLPLLVGAAVIGVFLGWCIMPSPPRQPALQYQNLNVYAAQIVYSGQGCTVLREPGMTTYIIEGPCQLVYPK